VRFAGARAWRKEHGMRLGTKLRSMALLIALASLAAPRPSTAGPAETKATADAEASARDHFQRGQRLSAAGDYASAYKEFAAGYALTERPLFLFNMAEAARANGEPGKARDNYLLFLHADPSNALAATAQARIAEIDRAAAPPSSPPPPPSVTAAPAKRDPVLVPAPLAGGTTPPPGSPVTATTPGGSPPAGALTTSGHAAETPVWKTWPFWAIVGGVAATTVVVYAATRDNPACGAGCSQLNFR
jgi:hypothetical protein